MHAQARERGNFETPNEIAMKLRIIFAIALTIGITAYSCAQPPRGRGPGGAAKQSTDMTPQIAWFGVLKEGLAEAKQTGKPILLVSAACQCAGVPGMW